MDFLYEVALELLSEIKNCLPALKTRLNDKISKGAATSQFDRLNKHWESALKNNDKLLKKKDPEHDYHTEKVLDSIEDAYFEAKGNFNDLLYDIELAAKASTPKSDDTIIETRS